MLRLVDAGGLRQIPKTDNDKTSNENVNLSAVSRLPMNNSLIILIFFCVNWVDIYHYLDMWRGRTNVNLCRI